MYRLDEVRELDLPVSIEFDLNDWTDREEGATSQDDAEQQSARERFADDPDRPLDDKLDFGPHASGRKKFDEEDEGGTSGESNDDADFEFDDDDDDVGDDEEEDDDAGFDDDEDDLDDDDDDDDDDFDDMDDDD